MGTLIVNQYLNVAGKDFVFTVKTDNPGTSASNQFTLATRLGFNYNYTINWGDGVVESYSVATQPTHTYPAVGEYEIKISGSFPTLYYNNGNDIDKIITIKNLGEVGWTTLERTFFGGNNIFGVDKPGDATIGTDFRSAWQGCSSLTSFPAINTSNGINFTFTWQNCSSLTSFPTINTSNGTSFSSTWQSCSSLTSFPAINTSKGTNFSFTWDFCSSLTSFPAIDTSKGTNFEYAWRGCSGLTSFPAIDTSKGTNFNFTWRQCSGLTSFPLVSPNKGNTFIGAWFACTNLVDFPAGFFDGWVGVPTNGCFSGTWGNCSSLSSQSVENILVSIDNSGVSAPTGTGETDRQIWIDYDVTTGSLSTAANNAVISLKAKNWQPLINGVLV